MLCKVLSDFVTIYVHIRILYARFWGIRLFTKEERFWIMGVITQLRCFNGNYNTES
jgi:cytochrome b subunit of formate dehydrogenase